MDQKGKGFEIRGCLTTPTSLLCFWRKDIMGKESTFRLIHSARGWSPAVTEDTGPLCCPSCVPPADRPVRQRTAQYTACWGVGWKTDPHAQPIATRSSSLKSEGLRVQLKHPLPLKVAKKQTRRYIRARARRAGSSHLFPSCQGGRDRILEFLWTQGGH